MPQNYKVFTGKNPISILFEEKEIGFEFVGNFEYKVLVDPIAQRAKVAMPNGKVLDDEFEFYFQNDDDFDGHEEFYEWLKFLLMSFEFYNSDVWEEKKD